MRPGDILGGRYVLDHEIGKGGMGVVWAAYDHDREQRVAIKLIIPDGDEALSKELRQRLKREAGACMKLDHPNVVRVFGFGETEKGEPYIVLELLDGQSLADLLKQQRRLAPKLAARIAAEVASGLFAAHEAKVIHRDLKPANIFLHREPGMEAGEYTTKVLDFGVCKDPDSVEVVKTKTGLIVGSVAYMSPEQIIRPKQVDGRADIWSLGTVLYEMLTGERAFVGNFENVLAQLIKVPTPGNTVSPVPAPTSKVRDVPVKLDAIVARCTLPHPQHRYENAEELARELYEVAGLRAPIRKPSASRPAVVVEGDVLRVFDEAIRESNAVPGASDERRFNPAARTLPLMQKSDVRVPPPVDEELDVAETLQMPARRLVQTPRPAVLEEAAGTQILAPDAHIPSPEPEWKKVVEEYREASKAYQIAELLGASNGETQMIEAKLETPIPSRPEPSATTSAMSAVSQEIVSSLPPMVRADSAPVRLDSAVTTGSRRRRSKVAMYAAMGFLAAAVAILAFAFVGRGKVREASPPDRNPEPAPTLIPSAVPIPLPPVKAAPTETVEPEVAPAPSAAPAVVNSTSTPVPNATALVPTEKPQAPVAQKTVITAAPRPSAAKPKVDLPKCTLVLLAKKVPCTKE